MLPYLKINKTGLVNDLQAPQLFLPPRLQVGNTD